LAAGVQGGAGDADGAQPEDTGEQRGWDLAAELVGRGQAHAARVDPDPAHPIAQGVDAQVVIGVAAGEQPAGGDVVSGASRRRRGRPRRSVANGSSTCSTRGVDLWWSGKHRHHGGNIQEVSAPDGWPLWTSDVRPGREHDTTAARADPDLLTQLADWVDDGQLGLGDLGNEGDADLLRIPIKKPADGELTVDQQAYTPSTAPCAAWENAPTPCLKPPSKHYAAGAAAQRAAVELPRDSCGTFDADRQHRRDPGPRIVQATSESGGARVPLPGRLRRSPAGMLGLTSPITRGRTRPYRGRPRRPSPGSAAAARC
jgi:hypothetical protein